MSIKRDNKEKHYNKKNLQKTSTNEERSNSNCTSNVHFSDYIKTEWKDGKRLPISIRINSELYKEFKPISKALYGSTCRAVESLMAAVVISAGNNVHFSNTMQPISIGELHIERPVRPRRLLPLQDFENFEEKSPESGEKCYCCDRTPVWRCFTVFPINPVKFLCNPHMNSFSRKGELVKKVKL